MGNRPSLLTNTSLVDVLRKPEILSKFVRAFNILSDVPMPSYNAGYPYSVAQFVGATFPRRVVTLHILRLYRDQFEMTGDILDEMFLENAYSKDAPLTERRKRIPDIYTIPTLYTEEQISKLHSVFHPASPSNEENKKRVSNDDIATGLDGSSFDRDADAFDYRKYGKYEEDPFADVERKTPISSGVYNDVMKILDQNLSTRAKAA